MPCAARGYPRLELFRGSAELLQRLGLVSGALRAPALALAPVHPRCFGHSTLYMR